MKKFLFMMAAVALFSCNTASKSEVATAQVAEVAAIETPDQAIAALVEGNTRFMNDSTIDLHEGMVRVKELTEGQAPFACVIGCSDSRVPAELLFDLGFGDLFVIRTAGNTVLDKTTAGSVEYAATHLGVKVIVVLGHTSCGAMTAIVEKDAHGDHAHNEAVESALGDMLEMIEEELPMDSDITVNDAVMANIDIQVKEIMEQEGVAKMVNEGTLKVVPAVYDIATGKVTFL